MKSGRLAENPHNGDHPQNLLVLPSGDLRGGLRGDPRGDLRGDHGIGGGRRRQDLRDPLDLAPPGVQGHQGLLLVVDNQGGIDKLPPTKGGGEESSNLLLGLVVLLVIIGSRPEIVGPPHKIGGQLEVEEGQLGEGLLPQEDPLPPPHGVAVGETPTAPETRGGLGIPGELPHGGAGVLRGLIGMDPIPVEGIGGVQLGAEGPGATRKGEAGGQEALPVGLQPGHIPVQAGRPGDRGEPLREVGGQPPEVTDPAPHTPDNASLRATADVRVTALG